MINEKHEHFDISIVSGMCEIDRTFKIRVRVTQPYHIVERQMSLDLLTFNTIRYDFNEYIKKLDCLNDLVKELFERIKDQ